MIDEKTGKRVVTAAEAGQLLGIDPSNVRHWGRKGLVKKITKSKQHVYYFRDEIVKRGKETAATRKTRGGRKRASEDAA